MKYLIIILAVMLASCSTQHHSTTTEQSTKQVKAAVKDSANFVHSDTSHLTKTNQATKRVKDSSNTVTVKTKDSSSVQVTFNGGNTDKPIAVVQRGDSTIIDAGGRNVTGVNVSHSKEHKHKQAAKAQTSDSTGVKSVSKQSAINDNASQTKAKDMAKQAVDKKASVADSSSKTKGMNLNFIITAAILIVCYFVMAYLKGWNPLNWFKK